MYNLDFIAKKLRLPLDMGKLEISHERIWDKARWNDDDDPATRHALSEISFVLKTKGFALGDIEDGSDSYILFLVPEDQAAKETLVKFANKYDRSINFNFGRRIGPNGIRMPF